MAAVLGRLVWSATTHSRNVNYFSTFSVRFDSEKTHLITHESSAIEPSKQEETRLYATDLAYVSGQPVKQASRHVYIYSPAKNAMQSGTFQTRYWKIEFEPEDRWENPMMGWASSADPLQAIDLTLRFTSQEAAVSFAERNGWSFSVTQPVKRNVSIKRTYADNFKFEPGQRLRFVKTK